MNRFHVSRDGTISKFEEGKSYLDGGFYADFELAKKRATKLLVAKMRADKQKISNLQMEIENAESGIESLESLPESEFNGYWSAF